MNTVLINGLLHSGIPATYHAKVGGTVRVKLPHVPMTADTQFVRFNLDTSSAATFNTNVSDFGEGRALPGHITVYCSQPGSGLVRITALDAFTEQPLPNVTPLEIELSGTDWL